MQGDSVASIVNDFNIYQDIESKVSHQRSAFLREGRPTAEVRIERIERAIKLLRENRDAICSALSEDYGCRHPFQTLAADILVSIDALKYCKKHVRRWMKRENRGAKFPLGIFGAKAYIDYVPLGVVGIISPWNFPIQLMMSPLANVLAAGNRAIIKPSELTPAVSNLMADLFGRYFEVSEVDVVTGGVDTAVAFCEQKFDHIVYTGAPGVGASVMQSAAKNLVPVTLELGGKCPVIAGEGVDLGKLVNRLMTFKTLNAGQICLAPDTLFIREEFLDEFIATAKNYFRDSFPDGLMDEGYAAIINPRHYARVLSYLDDASKRGARTELLGDIVSDVDTHKISPVVVINPENESLIEKEEIFGPLLLIKTYKEFDEVVDAINASERPLGLYYFGSNQKEIQCIKDRTTSGGMVVNDIASHALQDNMPLGGIGHSGMGSYHGVDGFRQFSHARGTFEQGMLSATGFFKTPYSDFKIRLLKKLIG